MVLIEPDFSEVKDTVEPGTYNVRVNSGEIKEFQTGTKYINWVMETFDEAIEKNNGRKVFHKTPIQGGGAFRLQEFYKACMGQPIDPANPNFEIEMFVGKAVKVTVIDGVNRQTGEPTGYTEIKTVTPIQ